MLGSEKGVSRYSREGGNPGFKPYFKTNFKTWIPAFAGMTVFFFFTGFFLQFSCTSYAADRPADRFRLGPSLEESEQSETLSDQPDFHFDKSKWNQMRQSIEEGRQPGEEFKPVQPSTRTVEAPKPPPGQIKVDLPYESSLSVTGRKIIKVELKNTHITKKRAEELGTKQDTQTFNMEQELQARIQGTVARKTTINVNFDDTKENVRDFSVVYQGDPDEVVQEAAFGDITLSLPATEFVNYNKQLFGIRTALKYKRFGLMAIGSRTKGTTETKRFTGTTTRNQFFVNDTSYIRRKFYDLTFSTAAQMAPIFSGHTILPIADLPELVFIEDTTGNDIRASTFTVATPTAPANAPLVIRMRLLSRGVDYSIDRLKGIITFTNQLNLNDRVAVDYILNDGSRLSSLVNAAAGTTDIVGVLIKDGNPEAPGVSQEIKRFYSVGSKNIQRDNGLGNFFLKVFDKNRETEIGNSLTPPQRYPDTIEMNFESGIFELKQLLPPEFGDVYAPNVTSGSPLHAVFSVEFNSILRTFTLRPNIVLQSETVTVDGRKVNRDIDYFIDYDIGLITFFNEDLIRESTVIEVTYEFAPFGGQLGETLVGARGTFDIVQSTQGSNIADLEKWTVGSTTLYNFAAKPTAPPDVRNTPNSLLVLEGDTTIKGLQVAKLPLKTNITLEAAQSKEDPNLFGRALIDSFEGLKQEDSSSMLQDSWLIAANPQFGGYNFVTDFQGRELNQTNSHLRWDETDVDTLDPNDNDAKQKALNIAYNLNPSSTVLEQASLVNVISLGGRDFSKKTSLELEIQGAGAAGAGVDLIVEYGTFNEDADGDGILDTEDTIPFDKVLNLGEDIGWNFDGPGDDLSTTATADNVTTPVGASDARLDTEDLNNDGSLNKTDIPATNTPIFRLSDGHVGVNSSTSPVVSDLNFTSRLLFQIPLNTSQLTEDERNRLQAVRQVRITIRNNNGASVARAGSFVLSKVSMVGISWEPAIVADPVISTMTVRGINNKDDTGYYVSLFGNGDFNNLYKDSVPSSTSKEQALAISYDLSSPSSGTTVVHYGSARDFSEHDRLKFFLRRPTAPEGTGRLCTANSGLDCGIFFLQAGSETEYQEAQINVANIPDGTTNGGDWLTVSIRQEDTNGDGSPDTWISETTTKIHPSGPGRIERISFGVSGFIMRIR